jgi:PilZ domain-containing protein
MNPGTARRKFRRVEFSAGVDVHIVASDGTWRLPCLMMDVAEGGAQLLLQKSLGSTRLTEFLLALSTTGGAFRRCEVVWMQENRIGVRFIEKDFDRLALARQARSEEQD